MQNTNQTSETGEEKQDEENEKKVEEKDKLLEKTAPSLPECEIRVVHGSAEIHSFIRNIVQPQNDNLKEEEQQQDEKEEEEQPTENAQRGIWSIKLPATNLNTAYTQVSHFVCSCLKEGSYNRHIHLETVLLQKFQF